jgi:hypothetical protein
MCSTLRVVLTVSALCHPTVLRCQHAADPTISTCDNQTLVRPGVGVPYQGTIRNDDYRFSVTVPEGLVGWGGVAPNAPFHGFAIFIRDSASETKSCIVFRIGIHVDLDEDKATTEQQEFRTQRITVGHRPARRTSSIGSAHGTIYENVNVWLQVPHGGDSHDLEIVLVTPKNEAAKTRGMFDKILASFHFW